MEWMYGTLTEAAEAVAFIPGDIPALRENLSASDGLLDYFAATWIDP